MIHDLGEIEVSPFATAEDWKGYPRGFEAHPARNHPRFVAELITRYRHIQDGEVPATLWDPMAGTGTTMFEGELLGLWPWGWDIDPRWRDLWSIHFKPTEVPEPGSIGLICTSPAYFGSNKARGATANQAARQASIRSTAGTQWAGDVPDGHIGECKTITAWTGRVRQILARCLDALAPGGHLIWIVRDRIVKNEPALFPEYNARLLELAGFQLLGGHWRKLMPTANERMRHELFLRQHGAEVMRATVAREWGLVARRRAA